MGTIRSMILPIPGRTEAEIEETIMDLILAQENPTIALLARPGYIALRVTAKAETAEAAYARMSPLVTELRKRLPVADYHIEQHVREDLVALLEKTHLSISAAESCTGGLIGKLMTDLPGSSAYFKGSAVTYWNEAKENVLGVSSETLSRYTAVSGETGKRDGRGQPPPVCIRHCSLDDRLRRSRKGGTWRAFRHRLPRCLRRIWYRGI